MNYNFKYPIPLTNGEINSDKEILFVRAAVRIAIFSGDKCLFINHPVKGWELPGGAIDPQETPKQAAIRELKEETGYIIDSEKVNFSEIIPVVDKRGGNWIDLVYFANINKDELEKISDFEFDEHWIEIEKMRDILPPQTFSKRFNLLKIS